MILNKQNLQGSTCNQSSAWEYQTLY